LDTTSQLSNFTPAPGYDPTIKELNDDHKLFKPFIYISTYNSLAEISGGFYNFTFSIGRPCWKALKDVYYKESNNNEIFAWKKVKALVKAKLQGGTNNYIDEERKILTSIAVLASLCSIDISPSVYFASNLVASHLGTCLSISQDRSKILVCYPPEPLITEASYELLDNDMLHYISQSFGQGIVEPGKHGEIIGELILILTCQQLQNRLQRSKKVNFFTGEIGLVDFLNDLLKDKIMLQNNNEHKYLKNAKISFTRFITIRTIPTIKDLEKGYETCVAFNLK